MIRSAWHVNVGGNAIGVQNEDGCSALDAVLSALATFTDAEFSALPTSEKFGRLTISVAPTSKEPT